MYRENVVRSRLLVCVDAIAGYLFRKGEFQFRAFKASVSIDTGRGLQRPISQMISHEAELDTSISVSDLATGQT